jgi:membrane-bound lytic murein transglycosylase D
MKTMLNRKLPSKGILSYGIFIMSVGSIDQPVFRVDSIDYSATVATHDSNQVAAPAIVNLPEATLNKTANRYVSTYIKGYRTTLEVAKERSTNFFPIMDSVLESFELPVELKYMAVVESNLKPHAKSRVGAKGLWQLMPVTGRYLGLAIKKNYDERVNVYKSTVAAARYMKELYGQFEDWLLVIAAYNSGAGNVRKAIRKSGSRNFWALQQFLPLETRNHVKRFIAVHVYFEGKPGFTTLTKAETKLYRKKISDFVAAAQTDSTSTAIELSVLR